MFPVYTWSFFNPNWYQTANIPTPIKLCVRYFYDTSLLFPNDQNHDDYLVSLNIIFDSIKFIVEVECEQLNLPFLDIM